MSDPSQGPLAGIRVIDVGTRISAPFCAGLLGELGADVIKVELPGEGDFMRTIGPFVPVEDGPDYSLFWAVEGRGRRGVTCDLRKPEGKELFKRLVATADVLCENFRPGTMERWGLGPADLPDELVYVRISVFGQTGPYAPRPGLDRLGHRLRRAPQPHGRSRSPARAARRHRLGLPHRHLRRLRRGAPRCTGGTRPGQGGDVIDAPLYGSILRILEWTLAGYDKLGIVRQREGNRLSTSAPLDNYPTADGHFICIVAGSDANFRRLCTAMDRQDLIEDPRFATLAERASRSGEINGIVADWTSSLPAEEITARCVEHDVPVGTAYSAADIFADPHMAARGDLVAVDDPVLGPVRQQAPFPRLANSPAPSRVAHHGSANTTARSGATWWPQRRRAGRPGLPRRDLSPSRAVSNE